MDRDSRNPQRGSIFPENEACFSRKQPTGFFHQGDNKHNFLEKDDSILKSGVSTRITKAWETKISGKLQI